MPPVDHHEARLAALEKGEAVLAERMDALRQLTDHRLTAIEAQLTRALAMLETLGKGSAADGSRWGIVRAVGTALLGVGATILGAYLLATGRR
jgi:hypothetical protein